MGMSFTISTGLELVWVSIVFQAPKGQLPMPSSVLWGEVEVVAITFSVLNYFRPKLWSEFKLFLSSYLENKKCMQQVEWTLEFIQRKSNACHFCQHFLHLGIGFWMMK